MIQGRPHLRTVHTCLERADLLNEWEVQFLRGVRARPQLSPRQHSVLSNLLAKVVREGAPA